MSGEISSNVSGTHDRDGEMQIRVWTNLPGNMYSTLLLPISVILYRGACFLWVLPEFMHVHTTTKVHFYFLYFSYRKSSYFMNYSVACLAIYPGEWRCVSLRFGKGLPSSPKPPLVWTEAILALTHIHVRTRGDPASLPGDP